MPFNYWIIKRRRKFSLLDGLKGFNFSLSLSLSFETYLFELMLFFFSPLSFLILNASTACIRPVPREIAVFVGRKEKRYILETI